MGYVTYSAVIEPVCSLGGKLKGLVIRHDLLTTQLPQHRLWSGRLKLSTGLRPVDVNSSPLPLPILVIYFRCRRM